MTQEALQRANEIQAELKKLEMEVKDLPRWIFDNRAYSEQKRGYIGRFLRMGRKNTPVIEASVKSTGFPFGNYDEIEMSEEDLNALIEVRKAKIEALTKELEEL